MQEDLAQSIWGGCSNDPHRYPKKPKTLSNASPMRAEQGKLAAMEKKMETPRDTKLTKNAQYSQKH